MGKTVTITYEYNVCKIWQTTCAKLNRIITVQECDATAAENCDQAGFIKMLNSGRESHSKAANHSTIKKVPGA